MKPLTDKRLEQLSADLKAHKKVGTPDELREVARYWLTQCEHLANNISAIRPSIAAYVMGERIRFHATQELAQWLDRQGPNDP
jgi:hypothetical protein